MENNTTEERKPALEMVGLDGNAFAILGRARRAARKAKWPTEKWEAVMAEATSGDYDQLLATMIKHFDTDPDSSVESQFAEELDQR